LEWADGSLDTVKGTIRSSWKKKGHNLIWSVDIPAGTIADLSIPSANGRFVLCNGKRVKTAGSNGRAFLSLESGHYEIKSKI
jgi:alpha-L-rhamnosidase